MLADDGTFTVQVPYGWQKMGPAMFEGSSVVSNWGEAFGSGLVAVYANQFMLQTLLDAQKTFLPQQQLVLMSRALSSPLGPIDVVQYLFPKIAGGGLQNLRILGYRQLSAQGGVPVMLIRYQSTLFPQRDAAFASLLAPALRTQVQVTTETVAVIWSPVNSDGLTWHFLYVMISAPQSVFERNQALYARIYQTFRFIPAGLAQKIRNNQRAQEIADGMNATMREVGQQQWRGLGDLVQGQEEGGGPRTDIPNPGSCSGGAIYKCGDDPYPRCYQTPPPSPYCKRWIIRP